MKKLILPLLISSVLIASLGIYSCGSKPKDADIKEAALKALSADPSCAGLDVTVNEGVATISGQVKDEGTRTMAEAAVAKVKGVKSVQNNTTVYVEPVIPPTTDVQASALAKAVSDAVKDYPGVTATVNNQVVTLTGEIQKSKLQKLMMSLNGLKSMGLKSIDSKGLVKK